MVYVLFSRPEHDVPVSYLYYYSGELVKLSNELGHKTLNKEKKESNKQNITKIIRLQKPLLIMFNGHGNDKTIFGHNDEVIISSDDNPELLSNTITYSLTCSSAAVLGPIAVKKGALCFIGYHSDFALGRDPDSEAVPRRDKIASLFLEPSNLLFSSLLRGVNVKESLEKAKKKMLDNIWFLNTTDKLNASYYAPFLFGNYIGLTAHGDEEASIKQV